MNSISLEEERDIMLEGMEAIGWPCRLVELPMAYKDLLRSHQEKEIEVENLRKKIKRLKNKIKQDELDDRQINQNFYMLGKLGIE